MTTVPVAPGRVPFLGHVTRLGRDPVGFLQALRAQGDLVAFQVGPRRIVAVNAPELIRQVLVTQAQNFHRGEVFVQARRALGDGLATADGSVHMRQRRVVQPAFHQDRLDAYLNVMRDQIRARTTTWIPHRPIRLDRELARLTVGVTAKTLFRTDLGDGAVREVRRSLSPVLNGIVKRAMIPAEWLHRVPTPGNRRYAAALGRLNSVVDKVISSYRADGVDHGDLLSMLVAAETSDEEVRTQVMHILMAGTDTTATSLSWACYEIARHPSVEQRIQHEIDTGLRGRAITRPALASLTYLDRVLTESIRLHTPIWLLVRRTVMTVHIGGTVLPPDTEVLISLPTLHRDPHLYPNPTRFDPDRWLRPAPDLAARAQYIPFGIGAHKCVGADFAWTLMKTALATICARWHLTLTPGHHVREIPRAFLRPNALRITPHPRLRPALRDAM